jgi:hypothetical protein
LYFVIILGLSISTAFIDILPSITGSL